MFPKISYGCVRSQPKLLEADLDWNDALFAIEQANSLAPATEWFYADLNGSNLQNAAALDSKRILVNGDGLRVREDRNGGRRHFCEIITS